MEHEAANSERAGLHSRRKPPQLDFMPDRIGRRFRFPRRTMRVAENKVAWPAIPLPIRLAGKAGDRLGTVAVTSCHSSLSIVRPPCHRAGCNAGTLESALPLSIRPRHTVP